MCIATNAIQSNGDVIQTSQDLSPEEKELLLELEDPLALYKPLEDMARKTHRELDELLTIKNDLIPKFVEERKTIVDKIEGLNSKTYDFLDKVKELNEMEIMSFINRLNKSVEYEIQRRDSLPVDVEASEDGDDGPRKLTLEEIEDQIDIRSMMEQPATDLQDHVHSVLSDKWVTVVEEYLTKCSQTIEHKKTSLQKDVNRLSVRKKETSACVDATEAANAVLTSLVALKNDREQNNVLTGASIVYGNLWTSDTYQPSLKSENDDASLKLGDAIVRQYIPEDWERVLPSGWKEWDISILKFFISSPSPQNILPSSFYHSLPTYALDLLEMPFQKGVPAPAETIFDANMHLGSCWKMSGRSGKVTLKLDKPAVVDSITIDHYPWIPSAHNPKEYAGHVYSAPRFVRVQGYPSCDNDEDCTAQLGFDGESPINYSSFEYRIDTFSDENNFSDVGPPTSSSQTFPISLVDIVDADDDDDNYGEPAFEESSGGCSAVKPTCDGAPDGTSKAPVQALTLFIDENWGNPDYTCIYRIRINSKA